MSSRSARTARINSAPSRSPEASPATKAMRTVALPNDAAAGNREEFDQRGKLRLRDGGRHQQRLCFVEQQPGFVQRLVCAANRHDALGTEAAPLQPFGID